MRKLVMMTAVFTLGAGMAMAEPAEGLWKTEPGDTGGYLHVAVSACGNALCGVIEKAFDKSGKVSENYAHIGKRMLWDMKPEGPGQYNNGKIWAPDRNKTYNSKMKLSGDKMDVSGCVLVVCRTQTWQRVN